jgi:hypothetical protein
MKNKVLTLLFLIILVSSMLVFTLHVATVQAVFGPNTGTLGNPVNYQGNDGQGSLYIYCTNVTTPPVYCQLENMSIYLQHSGGYVKSKMLVYRASDRALVAQTQEQVLNLTAGGGVWFLYTFNFTTMPILSPNTNYLFGFWTNQSSVDFPVFSSEPTSDYDQTIWGAYYYDSLSGVPPDPLANYVFHYKNKIDMFANYTFHVSGTVGNDYLNLANEGQGSDIIYCTNVTTPAAYCQLQNMTVALQDAGGYFKVKLLVYRASDNALIAQTQERELNMTTEGVPNYSWYTFNFTVPPVLAPSTRYLFGVWGNTSSGYYLTIGYGPTADYDETIWYSYYYDSLGGVPPDPLDKNSFHYKQKLDIYANYTQDYAPDLSFAAPETVHRQTYSLINSTVYDPDGSDDIINVSVPLNNSLTLTWNYLSGFNKTDPNNYATLGTGIKTTVNDTAVTLSWNVSLSLAYPEGSISVTAGNVTDVFGASGTESQTGIFTYTLGTPTIANFTSGSPVHRNTYGFVNCTVNDVDGYGDVSIVNMTLNGSVCLIWSSSGGFSKSDPLGYATLNAATSTVTYENSTAETLCWNVSFSPFYPEGTVQVLSAYVVDSLGLYSTGANSSFFTFIQGKPTMGSFTANVNPVVQGTPFSLNVTLNDVDGTADLSSCYVSMNLGDAQIFWNMSGGVDVYSGNYLNLTGCNRTVLNSTAVVITWMMLVDLNVGTTGVYVNSATVTDQTGLSGSGVTPQYLFDYKLKPLPPQQVWPYVQPPTNQTLVPPGNQTEQGNVTFPGPQPPETLQGFIQAHIGELGVLAVGGVIFYAAATGKTSKKRFSTSHKTWTRQNEKSKNPKWKDDKKKKRKKWSREKTWD